MSLLTSLSQLDTAPEAVDLRPFSRKLIAATKKVLKRLPVRHLQPVDPMISIGFDQCAVCIELFQPHDVIRSLPCKHFYHKACIDPWLLKHRSCPLCKQNILLACGIILEDGLSSSSNSSSESSTSSSTSASGNGRNAMGTMFGHFLPTAGEHMREGRLLWMNDSNICPPLFGFSCQQRSYMLCFCQRRQHGRPSPYRDNLHVLNSAGYNSMPASHPVHFRLNSVSNSSEYSISSFIQHCRTAEALARDTGHSAKMSTHRWYSKQQHLPGYIAAAATTSSSLSSSSSEKRNHYRYRADQRFPNRSVWRLSRLLSRRSRAWCLPWCFIRYSPVAPRSAAVASTPVCEPEKVEHTVTQSGPGNEKNSHTVCVHLLPYNRCHQPLSCYQRPPLPAVPAVDPRQRSAVAPDYTCCYSHFQPISTLAPDPMPCPGYYRACVHSHLPVEDFVVDVTSVVAKNAVDAISSQNNLQGKEEGQKMMLPAGDCLPSYDQAVCDFRARPNQAGFRAGRGCAAQIFTERCILEFRQYYQQPAVICFFVFATAFDSVHRESLWWIMVQLKILMIKVYYSPTTARVLVHNNFSQPFGIRSGVLQGCILLPILFNYAIDSILGRALHGEDGVELAHGRRLTDLGYSHNIYLLSASFGDLQSMVSVVNEVAKSVGLSLNTGKTLFSSCIPVQEKAPFEIDDCQLEEVDSLKYLGPRLRPKGQSKEGIVPPIDAVHRVFSNLRKCLWTRRDISIAIKNRVHRASVRSVLLYGCECWAIRVEDERKHWRHLTTTA
ncbi:unnamed protein product [Schistocephalus solidus]|uniref:RING-type domain-containing protein n=1 Tax=Schistocephalus solidus TaxID=70667 RepID=A0A183TLZ8_SCHSO|nr:unnamed protein product [Schistocephalus solidus]